MLEVDTLIDNLDQMVLPDYNSAGKIVNPPVVSLKLRDEIFIKGIVTQCSHTFKLPIISYGGKNKYALVGLNFSVEETTPYSASIIPNIGQYRNVSGLSARTNTATGIYPSSQTASNPSVPSSSSPSTRGGGGGSQVYAMTR